jgi:hypothetical protein
MQRRSLILSLIFYSKRRFKDPFLAKDNKDRLLMKNPSHPRTADGIRILGPLQGTPGGEVAGVWQASSREREESSGQDVVSEKEERAA